MENRFELQWPKDNLILDCFVNEILIYRYHWHETQFELRILMRGSETFSRGTETYHLKENDVLLINPGEGHASFTQEPNTCALVIHFLPTVFRPFLKKGQSYVFSNCRSDETNRDHAYYSRIRFYAAQIYQAAARNDLLAQYTAKASMQMLIATLLEFGTPDRIIDERKQDDERKEIVHRLIRYMEEHYKEKITLEDLAVYSQYNRTYVSTLFRSITGIKFYDYLTRIRFKYAVYELAATQKSLTEIAMNNGFPDLKTFNRHFRESFGCSPVEYRGKVLAEYIPNDQTVRKLLPPNDPYVQKKLKEYMRL